MTCRGWEELLHEQLDGTDAGRLERHLQTCPHCAAEQGAVRRFLAGVALLVPATAPAGLAERIAASLHTEVRERRRRQLRRRIASLGVLAAAAALLAAIGMRFWQSPVGTEKPSSSGTFIVKTQDAPPSGFRDSVAQAGNAVASLTSRAASETMDQTSSLLPLLPAPTLEPISAEPAPIEPLREASAGVSAGLSPVADSARRAVGLFLRDLPMGRTDNASSTN